MHDYAVVRGAFDRFEDVTSDAGSEGLRVATLIGRSTGSRHVEIAVVELTPGGHVGGHLHPFEESFLVLDGEVLLTIGDTSHALVADDFGFVPVSTPHAWRNVGDTPARLYRIRSPQPRRVGRATGTFPVAELAPPTAGAPVRELHPRSRHVGHFDEADLPAPGPLTMPGAHGHDIRDVSIRMMIDDVIGSIHHQVFVVQFEPSREPGFSGAAHYHDFEEAYFVVRGHGEVQLEDERFEVGAGDLVWAGTGTLHAWTARGDEPLRFIEMMAPRPPYTNMLFPERTWRELGDEVLPDA